jgi:hypothetical protein
MRRVTAAADRIDYLIRQRVVPCGPPSNANLSRAKYADLATAIGRTLRDQYDALAAPVPPHLAALSNGSKRRSRRVRKFSNALLDRDR